MTWIGMRLTLRNELNETVTLQSKWDPSHGVTTVVKGSASQDDPVWRVVGFWYGDHCAGGELDDIHARLCDYVNAYRYYTRDESWTFRFDRKPYSSASVSELYRECFEDFNDGSMETMRGLIGDLMTDVTAKGRYEYGTTLDWIRGLRA